MAQPTLRVSASSLSKGTATRKDLSSYSERLKELDRNGDGQLDLDEVCDAIDEIVRKEKTERTLKWMLAALAAFSLLTIAATVGLTYAVVALSKDTQVDGSVLQSKDSGETLRTGSFLQSQNATALAASVAASNDPAAALARITSIKVPSLKADEAYTVYKVDSITMLRNNSVLVRTSTGLDVLMPVDNLVGSAAVDTNATADVQGSGRKLLGKPNAGAEMVAITVNQGPAGYRSYALDPVDASLTTVGDIKDMINKKDFLSPGAGIMKLFMDGTELSNNQKLSTIRNLVKTWTMQTRQVDVYADPCQPGMMCAAVVIEPVPVYLPYDDDVGGIKRERQAKYNDMKDDQVIKPRGGGTVLADTTLISSISSCPSITSCAVDKEIKVVAIA